MIAIGNFFFKYRNLLFPIFALIIFLPSPEIFTAERFGKNFYLIPMIIGIAVSFTGQGIRAATIGLKYIKRGGKDKKVYATDLVTDGLFHHCRNPLYVGNILMLAGVAILSNSLIFVLIALPFFCFIYQAIVRAEENFLSNKFGPGFATYCRDVNRWVPKLKGLANTFRSMKFNWQRCVVNEYNTVYLLLLSIYIVLLTHHPDLASLDGNEKISISLIVFFTLSFVYLFIRFLKKSKRLTAPA